MINPATPLTIPSGEGFVNTNPIRWYEKVCSVIVEVPNKTVDQHPTVWFGRHTVRYGVGLCTKPDARPQLIESFATEVRFLPNSWGNLILGWWMLHPQIGTFVPFVS
jgi:hypothetical protein